MDYLRRYMIMKFSESLTDEERDFLIGQDRERQHKEVMNELSKIKRQGSFGLDFASNIAGNATYDLFLMFARKLIKQLR